MSLPNTLKFFAALILVLLVAFPSQANANPRNSGKTTDPKLAQEQLEQPQDHQDVPEDQITEEEDEEDQQRPASNSSLNYIFYMIYKVKFEDIFRFPDRSGTQNSSGINLININSLVDYFNNPKI